MKRIIKTYIPSACITFTLTVLCTCTSNLLQGCTAMYNQWFMQIFAFIVVIDVLDFGLGYINFKTYTSYIITEMIIAYVIMLLFGYFGYWFSFTLKSLLLISIIFLVVYACVHSYFYKMSRMQVDEINAMLKK